MAGLSVALQARLRSYILSAPDQANEVQPKSIRTLKIPDYFAEYRDKGDGFASFLGCSIIAKVEHTPTFSRPELTPLVQITFNDSSGQNIVSKADYAESGPKAVLSMSPSLF